MSQIIITRSDAISQGLARYFTGKPCRNGHIDWRLVVNWTCVQCAKDSATSAYSKDPGKFIARRLEAYRANAESEKAKMRAHYAANIETAKRQKRQRYYANPEKMRRDARQWAQANPEKRRAQHSTRKASLRRALPAWHGEMDEFLALEAADLCGLRKAATGIDWHVDHMIPLLSRKASGLHCAANLQVIPAVMNMRKGNRMALTEPGEWILCL